MAETADLLHDLNRLSRERFRDGQTILSFSGFLERLRSQPQALIRSSAVYLRDVFDHFGFVKSPAGAEERRRWKLFDVGTERHVPIVGNETVHEEIYRSLVSFARQGYSNKLIMLHGPNGSAKSSIIESIAFAMNRYSELDQGAVYRFNWIFPTDRSSNPQSSGESGPIGFAGRNDSKHSQSDHSYAFLDEGRIAAKIHSEFKENPIYLIPMPQREVWLREWISRSDGIKPEDVELPPHVLLGGLSKRNQLIFENMLGAYDGDLAKVLRHVQVERFTFSRQYRVGIATVEPQLSIDALERQLTMDRNMANLPPFLHNVSFHEAMGPLVEANRGMIEFADMLKRPLEAFKYLLSTVEKGTLNLPSSTANIDSVFFATTNEKHLDAFKTLPDFASFKSRFELVTVPYLLKPTQEAEIYKPDIQILKKSKAIAPHTLDLLSQWAVMTRLRQPDPEFYEPNIQPMINKLEPESKIDLYEQRPVRGDFSRHDQAALSELSQKIASEFKDVVAYEGRFGASPREIRGILYRAVQNPKHKSLTPMAIFDELERLIKDRSVYEFLQLEPRGKYHQAHEFILSIKQNFAEIFSREATMAMNLVEETEYETMLRRYVANVVAEVKREKILNPITNTFEFPNQQLMSDVEKIIGVSGSAAAHRENLLGRVAAYRLNHPKEEIDVIKVFHDFLKKIQEHYYIDHQKIVGNNFRAVLLLDTDDMGSLTAGEIAQARKTLQNLNSRYGYDLDSAKDCLRFLLSYQAHAQKS